MEVTNTTLTPTTGARGCSCRQHSSANEITPALPGQTCSPDQGCEDPRSVSVLGHVLEMSLSKDRDAPRLEQLELGRAAEESGDTGQVATVKVVGGPVLPRPPEGWTLSLAEDFCTDYLGSSPAMTVCRGLPRVDVVARLGDCGQDVLVRSDPAGHSVMKPRITAHAY